MTVDQPASGLRPAPGPHPAPAPVRLRMLLEAGGLVVAPFAYDGLQARLAEHAGFSALYCTGFGTAASHGLPDVGLLGLAEMAGNGRRLARATTLPVICDADTGFGNAVSVVRTVEEYAAAGIAALHLEDQVWPKRCGFMAGKEVVAAEEATAKVRAAVDASRRLGEHGPVVIARTDALAPHGWDEVVQRARRFADVGADLIFVDGIRRRDDAARYVELLGDLPLVYNGMLPVRDVTAFGFRLMLASATLMASFAAQRAAFEALAQDGTIPLEGVGELFDTMNRVLGLDEVEELRQTYGT